MEVVNDEMFCFMDWGEFIVFGKEFCLEWQYIMKKFFDQELYDFDD